MSLLTLVVSGGCSPKKSKDPSALLQKVTSSAPKANPAPDFALEVREGSLSVYNEVTNTGSLQVEDGKPYSLVVSSKSTALSLSLVVEAQPARTLVLGGNSLQLSGIGNKVLKITATQQGFDPRIKLYNIGVTCLASQLNGFAVDPNQISVTQDDLNLFTYTAPNIASGGGGSYECAWDFNGDGIRDSAFGPCAQGQSMMYSNHVNIRQVGVMVRDLTCNKILVASAPIGLGNYSLNYKPNPLQPYLHANVASTTLVNDARLNLKHLSTNPGTSNHVMCSYAKQNGVGSFAVSGLNDYGIAGNRSHGIAVGYQNLTDTFDLSNNTGGISGASAVMDSGQFATDQSPDSYSRLTFLGDSQFCSGTISAVPKKVSSAPCGPGFIGVDGSYLVKAQGTFSCLNLPSSDASQKVNLTEGSFYCEVLTFDACVGNGAGPAPGNPVPPAPGNPGPANPGTPSNPGGGPVFL